MSLDLTLHTAPLVPLEADVLSPAGSAGCSALEAAKLVVVHGNQSAELGEFFRVSGAANGEIHLTGDLSRVKLIGAGMAEGRIVVHGPVGMHVGARMTGGEIVVEGDAGDWVGPEMSGGRIIVKGNAGHLVGSASRGSPAGTPGRRDPGVRQRRQRGRWRHAARADRHRRQHRRLHGREHAGRHGGGARAAWARAPGPGMKRGSIVCMHPAEMLPTFSYACTYRPVFLRLYLSLPSRTGPPVTDAQMDGAISAGAATAVELNRGEILCLDSGPTAAGS